MRSTTPLASTVPGFVTVSAQVRRPPRATGSGFTTMTRPSSGFGRVVVVVLVDVVVVLVVPGGGGVEDAAATARQHGFEPPLELVGLQRPLQARAPVDEPAVEPHLPGEPVARGPFGVDFGDAVAVPLQRLRRHRTAQLVDRD